MRHYDYIFTGAGLAAQMTVYRMVQSGKFGGKSVLMIDADAKKTNDRTWSFWETHNGEFDKIVLRKWDAATFISSSNNDKSAVFERMMDLSPYRYKTIRGTDFYDLVRERITDSDIDFLNEPVTDFYEAGNHALVKTATKSFTCNKIFNSIYKPDWAASQTKYPVLQQHFIGWFVKTEKPVFNPNLPTFMDFSVEQKGNTRFMYILPFSEDEALVEYTLFSKDHLLDSEYELAIVDYLKKLGAKNYTIVEKERGSIPMTCYPFWKRNSKNILNIGSAGGWTKASTGYTFKNTMKKSADLIKFLQEDSDMRHFHRMNRFWYYDMLLLDILAENNQRGHEIFSAMFRNSNPAAIFKFLDEETSISEDLSVIWKCPKKLFISALFNRLFR